MTRCACCDWSKFLLEMTLLPSGKKSGWLPPDVVISLFDCRPSKTYSPDGEMLSRCAYTMLFPSVLQDGEKFPSDAGCNGSVIKLSPSILTLLITPTDELNANHMPSDERSRANPKF